MIIVFWTNKKSFDDFVCLWDTIIVLKNMSLKLTFSIFNFMITDYR